MYFRSYWTGKSYCFAFCWKSWWDRTFWDPKKVKVFFFFWEWICINSFSHKLITWKFSVKLKEKDATWLPGSLYSSYSAPGEVKKGDPGQHLKFNDNLHKLALQGPEFDSCSISFIKWLLSLQYPVVRV